MRDLAEGWEPSRMDELQKIEKLIGKTNLNKILAGNVEDLMEEPYWEKLYSYFSNSGEMPYGVAKARTGEPDAWILDYIENLERKKRKSHIISTVLS